MSIANQTELATDEIIAQTQVEANSLPSLLIIEDNRDMRNYIVESLARDFRVLTANNGEQGVAVATAEIPDVIISDMMMPKMDGYQVTQTLRSNPATNHIPIVLLTARGDRESRMRGWHEKADDYLTKPFNIEELTTRLRNLLEIRSLLRKRFSEQLFAPCEATDVVEKDDNESKQIALQRAFIDQLNEILETRYSEATTSIDEIFEAMLMSRRQFFRKMKPILDMTPAEYLRRFRLEKAKALLNSGKSANFVTFEVGFSSQSYFGKCFKAQYGISPNEFKTRVAQTIQ
jgi:DNA-binding response OmpR family regulator